MYVAVTSAHWRRRHGFRRMIWRRRNKVGKWGVLTSRFRGEEYLFCQSRGRDDVKLVDYLLEQTEKSGDGMAVSSLICSFLWYQYCRYRLWARLKGMDQCVGLEEARASTTLKIYQLKAQRS